MYVCWFWFWYWFSFIKYLIWCGWSVIDWNIRGRCLLCLEIELQLSLKWSPFLQKSYFIYYPDYTPRCNWLRGKFNRTEQKIKRKKKRKRKKEEITPSASIVIIISKIKRDFSQSKRNKIANRRWRSYGRLGPTEGVWCEWSHRRSTPIAKKKRKIKIKRETKTRGPALSLSLFLSLWCYSAIQTRIHSIALFVCLFLSLFLRLLPLSLASSPVRCSSRDNSTGRWKWRAVGKRRRLGYRSACELKKVSTDCHNRKVKLLRSRYFFAFLSDFNLDHFDFSYLWGFCCGFCLQFQYFRRFLFFFFSVLRYWCLSFSFLFSPIYLKFETFLRQLKSKL